MTRAVCRGLHDASSPEKTSVSFWEKTKHGSPWQTNHYLFGVYKCLSNFWFHQGEPNCRNQKWVPSDVFFLNEQKEMSILLVL